MFLLIITAEGFEGHYLLVLFSFLILIVGIEINPSLLSYIELQDWLCGRQDTLMSQKEPCHNLFIYRAIESLRDSV